MKSLLRTILDECEKNKLMYRANAYDLYDNGCRDMVVPWGYDFTALAETMSEVELNERRGNVQIIPESKVKSHSELIKEIKGEEIEDIQNAWYSDEKERETQFNKIKNMSDEVIINLNPEKYYCGHYWIVWANYGGNEHLDCFTDYDTDLDKYFDVNKLIDKWEDQYYKFKLGLI
jgi:hypothetical protein